MAKANNAILSRLELSQSHSLPIPVQSNVSLLRLAELGANDADIAWPVFVALWTELSAPSTETAPRPPLMIGIDGIAHLMRPSQYRAADYSVIHAHDLALVQLLMRYMSGEADLANGGAVIAATSASNNPSGPSFSSELAALDSGPGQGQLRSSPAPDARVTDCLRRARVLRLEGLSRAEAKALLEYYAASGMLRERVDRTSVAERWTLAGGGVVGEIERAVRGMRL